MARKPRADLLAVRVGTNFARDAIGRRDRFFINKDVGADAMPTKACVERSPYTSYFREHLFLGVLYSNRVLGVVIRVREAGSDPIV